LYNGVKNGKRAWPDYINLIKDKRLRKNRKIDFYRKIRNINDSKMNNNKEIKINEINKNEEFIIIDKYLIENNRLYITLYEHDKGSEKVVYKKYLIPFLKELKDILKKCHNDKNHPSLEETIKSIKNSNYYWDDIFEDVSKYIKNCGVCSGKFQ